MKTRKELRLRRKFGIRAKIAGTALRPRLTVFRSNTSMYVQVIDDVKNETLFQTQSKGKNKEVAKKLADNIIAFTKKKKVAAVVFDRGGFRYHGSIKQLAETLREGGVTI